VRRNCWETFRICQAIAGISGILPIKSDKHTLANAHASFPPHFPAKEPCIHFPYSYAITLLAIAGRIKNMSLVWLDMANKPVIILNFKAYEESEGDRALKLAEIASEVSLVSGARIVIAPPLVVMKECTRFGLEVFSQHCDPDKPGAHTGSVTSYALKHAGIAGSLLNHSERRMTHEDVKSAVDNLREDGLISLVCSRDIRESAQLSIFKPSYIAVEPPELIGTGISVSTAKPEVVEGAVEAVRANGNVPVICGAGISDGADVKKAIELGTEGVLVSSAFAKAKDPKKLLEEMAGAIG
jgi:triosephosphate isomerase (TIM)